MSIPKKKNLEKQISFRIPDEYMEKMKVLSEKEGVFISDIARHAVKQFFDDKEPKSP